MLTFVLPHFPLNTATSLPETLAPSVQHLLRRARFQAASCLPSILYQRYLALDFAPQTLLAVPIYQQMGMNTTTLLDARCFALDEDEAKQYVDGLNQFYDKDAHFQLITPKIWQVRLPECDDFYAPSVLDIGGQTDAMYRSEQQAHPKWLQLSTELQMWLHQYPLNQQRQQHRQAIINGLWLWQPKQASAPFQAAYLACDSQWQVFSQIKQQIDFPKDFLSLQQKCQQENIDMQQLTLFSEDFVGSVLSQDDWAAEHIWQHWENHFFAPIWQHLNQIKQLQIITEQGIWQIRASAWWQWWR